MSESIQYPYLEVLADQFQDEGMARRYLAALDPNASAFSFRTFDDNSDRNHASLTRTFNGSFDELASTLIRLNSLGAGVFVTVNETDLKGGKRENITRARAFWQEDDEGQKALIEGPHIPQPSIVVKTSQSGERSKYHRYWKIKDGDCEGFQVAHQDIMNVMVERYGSDKNAKDLARILRVPGFFHSKYSNDPEKSQDGTPFLVELEWGRDTALTFDEAFEAFGRSEVATLPVAYHTSLPSAGYFETLTDQQIIEIKSAVAKTPVDLGAEKSYQPWVDMGMSLHRVPGGFDIWKEWSEESSHWNENEFMSTWASFGKSGGPERSYRSIFTVAENDHGWINPARGGVAVEEKILTDDRTMDSFFDSKVTTVTLDMIRAKPVARASLQGMFPLRCTTALCAQGGAGKTTVLVHKAAEIIAEHGVEVLVISAEDEVEDYVTKIHNLVYTHPYAANEATIADRFHVMDMRGTGVRLVEGTTIFKPSQAGKEISKLISERLPNVGLIIVETLSRMSGGETNEHFESCVSACDQIAVENNAAVVLVHHTGKTQAREEMNDIYFGRGGSTLGDNTRSFISILKVKQKEADALNLDVTPEAVERGHVIQVEHVRMSYAPRVPAEYFQLSPGVSHGIVLKPLEAKELTSSDELAMILEREKQQEDAARGKVKELIKASGGRYPKRDFEKETQKKIGINQGSGKELLVQMIEEGAIEEISIKVGRQNKLYLVIPGESADYDRLKEGSR